MSGGIALIHGQGGEDIKRLLSACAAALIFASLIIFPTEASDAAANGLRLCAKLMIPTLFPFFVATFLLSELGFAEALGRLISPAASRLFGVSGKAATAFVVGLCGGYPMGAAYIADMRKRGLISSEESARLLPFCANSGPAFIVGAVGVGIFSSSLAGLFLYAVHIISAAVGGMILGGGGGNPDVADEQKSTSFAKALTNAVRRSVVSMLYVCGFVVTFSVFCELLCAFGPFELVSAKLSSFFGCDLLFGKALFIGIFELGSGVGVMSGLSLSPECLALAAFLVGWGGISVHFQTFALLDEGDIKTARYIIGRFMIAAVAAIIAYFASLPLF